MRIRSGFQVSPLIAISLLFAAPAALAQTTTEPDLKSPAQLWPDQSKPAEPGADLKPLSELLKDQPAGPALETPDTLFPTPPSPAVAPTEPLKPLSELLGEEGAAASEKPSAENQSVSRLLNEAPAVGPKPETDFTEVSKALSETKPD